MYQEIHCQNGCNFCYGPKLLNIKLQDLKDTCKLSIKTNSVVHYDPAHVNCKGEKRDGGSAIVSSVSGLRGAHRACGTKFSGDHANRRGMRVVFGMAKVPIMS